MKTRITLICHGATASNRSAAFPADEPLEAKALKQTASLKGRLPHADHVLVSPSLRTRQTAQALGLLAESDTVLAECDYGRWAGSTMQAISQQEPEALATWIGDLSAAPHGGEAMADLFARAAGWLAGALGKGGHTIAITHASVIRACILHVLQADHAAFWKVDVEPLSCTQLSSDGRRWSLRLPSHIDTGAG